MPQLHTRVDEQLQRFSSRATRQIALRFGGHYGMILGSGYPKSGTSWMCQLLGNYFDVPHPTRYSAPIAMEAIVQNHWLYDSRFPNAAYLVRDGRDVMVSMYFYNMREMKLSRRPRSVSKLRARLDRVLGAGYDPDAVEDNLPKYIEAEFLHPFTYRHANWSTHVDSWADAGHRNVSLARYEDLLAGPHASLANLVCSLTGEEADSSRVERAISMYDFTGSGRAPGTEDRGSFMRKGISGDWTNYFTRKAAETFNQHGGETLIKLGYETSEDWVSRI